MKEYLFRLVSESRDSNQALNKIREYLQARVLVNLQQSGAMIPLAFHGGTALRFLYDLKRFSEDLDFTLEKTSGGYDLRSYLHNLQRSFNQEGYELDIRVSDQKTVHSAFLRFKGLLFELGLSMHQSENLSIKIEVDTNPPEGAILETTMVRRFDILQLQHHDRSSLLAGKLHALLQRRYTKGRDIYDLMWYLLDSRWPEPNINMLRNALIQTGWNLPLPDKNNWRDFICRKLESVDWAKAIKDVQPFLESRDEAVLLTKNNLIQLLGNKE